MTKKLNEETTYSASVTMNDGEGNKTASINTDDFNELARFLELSGIKAQGNNSSSLPPSCGEGWADDNPMNMDAAGYETGGDAEEVEVIIPGEEPRVEEVVDTDQAEYDFGHVPDHPRPYSMDVHDYKGRSETDTDKKNFRRVNNYGDNALPKTEEENYSDDPICPTCDGEDYLDLEHNEVCPSCDGFGHILDSDVSEATDVDLAELDRLTQLAGAPAYKIRKLDDSEVEEGMATGMFKAMDKLTKSRKDDEDGEMDEARARGPNNREDTMMNRIARKQEQGKISKFNPNDKKEPEDKYAAMAKKYGIEEKLTVEELEAQIGEELNSFINEGHSDWEVDMKPSSGKGHSHKVKARSSSEAIKKAEKKHKKDRPSDNVSYKITAKKVNEQKLNEFGNRNPLDRHPLRNEMMTAMEEMIRWTGNIVDAAESVADEFAAKMNTSAENIKKYLITIYSKMDKKDINRSQRAND